MLNVRVPEEDLELRPRITVVGVGGGGSNAVNNMIRTELQGVEFLVCNTDAQSLKMSLSDRKIQLGAQLTRGLGGGARPDVGRAATEESLEEIMGYLEGSNMVFITAGMGGATGTGGAPVIARAAREAGILTVGVITKPFHFEGAHRMRLAEAGIEELQQYVDTLLIIPNQNLFRVANEKTTFADAFKMADEVLHSGVRGVTDLMVMPGLINLDFADIRSVMSEMGKAMMGTGEATGDRRAVEAAEAAINNPLLEDASMQGARGLLVNITGGMDMTLFEVDEAMNRIRDEVDPDANIIFGSTFSPELEGKIRVSVVATGIDQASRHRQSPSNTGFTGAIAQSPQMGGYPANETTNPYAKQQQASVIAPNAFGRGVALRTGAPNTNAVGNTQQQQTTQAPQQRTGTTSARATAAMNTSPSYFGRGAGASAARRIEEEPMTVGALEAETSEDAYADQYQAQTEQHYEVPVQQQAAYQPQQQQQQVQQRGERDDDGSFIPPAPVMLEGKPVSATAASAQPQARQADVFAEADMANRRTPQTQSSFSAEKRPGLFDRLTGNNGRQPAQQQPKQPQQAAPQQQPSLAVDNSDRMPPGINSLDDELDIPAFLRRQAN